MHQDADENVQDQNLLNDEITEQLAGLQSQAAVPADDSTAPAAQPADNYQRDGIDSPVAQPGAVVAPAPYEPPTDIEPSVAAENTEAVQDMVTPEEPAVDTPTPTPSVVPEPPQDDQPADDTAVAEPASEEAVDAQAIDNAVAPLTAEEDAEEPEEAPAESETEPETEETPSFETSGEEGDLADIKRKALEELSPMVDKLDLAPEKRYDVLMEMIQASDNRDLVAQAYEAAHEIEDENLKAQALLEIINEVDYLTKDENKEQ